MFNPKELSVINNYFNVIFCTSASCELESGNGDHWIIIKIQNHSPELEETDTMLHSYSYELYRRNTDLDCLQLQAEYESALDAVWSIIDQDNHKNHGNDGCDNKLLRIDKIRLDDVIKEFA